MTTPKAAIYQYLHDHPEGASCFTLSSELKLSRKTVQHHLMNSPLIYLDRWEAYDCPTGIRWRPVYVAIRKPEDTPKPDRSPTHADLK